MDGEARSSQASLCSVAAGSPLGTACARASWPRPPAGRVGTSRAYVPRRRGPVWFRVSRHRFLGSRGKGGCARGGPGPSSTPGCTRRGLRPRTTPLPGLPRPASAGRRLGRRAARPLPGHLRVQQRQIGPREFARIPRHLHCFEVKVDDAKFHWLSWVEGTKGAGPEVTVTWGDLARGNRDGTSLSSCDGARRLLRRRRCTPTSTNQPATPCLVGTGDGLEHGHLSPGLSVVLRPRVTTAGRSRGRRGPRPLSATQGSVALTCGKAWVGRAKTSPRACFRTGHKCSDTVEDQAGFPPAGETPGQVENTRGWNEARGAGLEAEA